MCSLVSGVQQPWKELLDESPHELPAAGAALPWRRRSTPRCRIAEKNGSATPLAASPGPSDRQNGRANGTSPSIGHLSQRMCAPYTSGDGGGTSVPTPIGFLAGLNFSLP